MRDDGLLCCNAWVGFLNRFTVFNMYQVCYGLVHFLRAHPFALVVKPASGGVLSVSGLTQSKKESRAGAANSPQIHRKFD